MKKYISLFFLLSIFLFVLAGCSSKDLPLLNNDKMLNNEQEEKEALSNDILGISFAAEGVTKTGIKLVCIQGNKDFSEELFTGSSFWLEKKEENQWISIESILDFAWTSEAWIINKNSKTEWEINWEWLYGELTAGSYRLGKEVTAFRETGDFDTYIYYVYFEIAD